MAFFECSNASNKVVLLLKYNKRFAFASMSTHYADDGEVNKYIIIWEKPYRRNVVFRLMAGCIILAHIIQFLLSFI